MTRIPHVVFKGIMRNGRMVHDHPELFRKYKDSLEGKRVDLTLLEERKPKTRSQLGYYFGGIIEATCMTSNVFAGWTKEEIHEYLMTKLRSYSKEIFYPDGHREILSCHDRLEDYDLDQTKQYIDQVIIFLNMTHGLVVLDPDEYKYEKYHRTIVAPHESMD